MARERGTLLEPCPSVLRSRQIALRFQRLGKIVHRCQRIRVLVAQQTAASLQYLLLYPVRSDMVAGFAESERKPCSGPGVLEVTGALLITWRCFNSLRGDEIPQCCQDLAGLCYQTAMTQCVISRLA